MSENELQRTIIEELILKPRTSQQLAWDLQVDHGTVADALDELRLAGAVATRFGDAPGDAICERCRATLEGTQPDDPMRRGSCLEWPGVRRFSYRPGCLRLLRWADFEGAGRRGGNSMPNLDSAQWYESAHTPTKATRDPEKRKADAKRRAQIITPRMKAIAAVHITWAKIRRDLKGDKDELRESRLAFMSRVMKRDVKSSRDLSLSKLGKVLDAMRDLERAPALPGVSSSEFRVSSSQPETGNTKLETEIIHLATAAQTIAINKLFAHLRWSLEAIEGFVKKRFKTTSTRMLTVEQANKLTMILLTIAASRDIKDRTKVERVSRQMIRAEIPALKRRLGIDQRPTDDGGPETEDYESDG